MFSVMCGLSCSLFMVVGCSYFYVVFVFYSRYLYFYLFYLISKGIFQVKSSQVKLSFIVIPLHVGTYSGTKCRASQDHGAT